MEAVKKGANRQEAHEIIRQCSMAAVDKMKKGESFDLLSDLAGHPEMKLSKDDIKGILDPALYTGRCGHQVENLVAKVRPMLGEVNKEIADINL